MAKTKAKEKPEPTWETRVAEARKRLESLKTSELLDYVDQIDWDKPDPEGDVIFPLIDERTPFNTIETELGELESGIESLGKKVDALSDKLTQALNDLWKALRTHQHSEGRVVRDL